MAQLLQPQYINPVINQDFPDPSVIEVKGQGYFAYATHDKFSPTLNNILVKHSWDLINWSETKGALISPPDWAKNCQRFWCPHVEKINGGFRMYYAAEPDTDDGMCLALAVSDTPLAFKDSGKPLGKIAASTYQMIDPCFFIDPVTKKHFLYYGSAHEPIRVVELAADGKTFLTEPKAVLYPGEGTFHKLREGAYVTYSEKWKRYFLWVSGDNTWAERSYAISVFWSDEPVGVFEKIPDEHVILQPNDHWDSPGQNCIIEDAEGNEWMIYHAVDTKDRFIAGTNIFLRKTCIDRILYTDDGWPYVKNGSPSFELQDAPVVMP
jgi:arabinan endo-1,5-alpha-L-arabinosidase